MSHLRRVLVPAGAAVVAALVPAHASAQSTTKPIHVYRGLFGPTDAEQNLPQRLFVGMSIYGAADDNSRFATGSDIGDASLQAQRGYQGGQASLAFRRQRTRSLVTIDGATALRYFAGLHDVTTSQHGGSINAQLVPGQRWKVQLAAGLSYSPTYQLQLTPSSAGADDAPVAATGDDFTVARQRMFGYGASTAVTYAPSRNRELVLNAGSRQSVFIDGPDYSARSAGVRFTQRLSRSFALRLGYGRAVEGRSDTTASTLHNLDVGLNYGRGLSLSPRTSISWSSGSAIVSAAGTRHFELTGSAFLKHQVSPRWTAQVGFDRQMQAIEALPRPFVADGVHGSISGYLTRRIALHVTPAYGRGADVAFPATKYTSVSTQARLEVALNRFWAVYAEQFFYNYRFSAPAGVPSSLSGLRRQGARAGLTLWAPAIR